MAEMLRATAGLLRRVSVLLLARLAARNNGKLCWLMASILLCCG